MAEIPTPPENPFESQGPSLTSNGGNGNGNGGDEQLLEGTPDVAAKKGKAFLVLAVMGAIVLFLLYNIFSSGHSSKTEEKPKSIVVAKPVEPPPLPVAEPTPAAPPISLVAPTLPKPPEVPKIENLNPLVPERENAAQVQAAARLHSTMMVKDGSEGVLSGLGSSTPNAAATASTDPNSQFAAAVANTKTETVQATRIANLNRTIAQGRIIQATTESAINTDLPAPIRAIVSRDTYAEAGMTVLIPKGSRLIGSYNTTLTGGQSRVFVVWTRVIRPDGVDVALGSPMVDAIGQAGVTGQIDTKFQEMFSRSVLASVMNIALAIGSDKISGGSTTTTNNASGTSTTGDAATTATTNALNRLGSVTDSFIQKFLNVQPTILIDQGTPVNVFVNKDLVFPEDATGARILN